MVAQSQFIEMFGDPIENTKRWEQKRLNDLGTLDRGVSRARPRNSPDLLGGPYPLVQTGEVANCETYIKEYLSTYSEKGLAQSKMWPEGTLCITIAANIAKTGILTFEACFPDSVVGFIPNDEVNLLFVHHWFKAVQHHLEELAPSTAQKNMNLGVLSNLKVISPPRVHQDRFASMVKQADKSKFDGLKSQFIEMFRAAPKEHVHLKDVATYSIGLTYKPDNVKPTGIPVLRSGNIQEESLDFGDLVRVDSSIPDTLLLRDGDILMCSRNGSAHLVGKVARIRELPEPMTYGAFMTVIRSEYMDFLFLFFQSDGFRQQISYGKSSTMNQITQKMLDQITLDLPSKAEIGRLSPLLEQADKSKYLS